MIHFHAPTTVLVFTWKEVTYSLSHLLIFKHVLAYYTYLEGRGRHPRVTARSIARYLIRVGVRVRVRVKVWVRVREG